MASVWIQFIICVLVIAYTGRLVAKYGDAIAEKTGLGGVWVGVALLALATSLPELFTGISAVMFVTPPAPDLAVGDLFGSNAFNLGIIALLDIAHRSTPLLAAATPGGHLRVAWLGLILLFVAAGCVLLSNLSDMGIGWIGIYSPIIILLFLLILRRTYTYEQEQQPEPEEVTTEHEDAPLWKTYVRFSIAAAFVVAAGIWLAFIGSDIAELTGWGDTFVGTLFLAFSTSLPEVVVSLAALRIGAVDMAIANIVGSNMFNIALIGVIDLFYLESPILADVSNTHMVAVVTVLLMTAILITALTFRTRRRTPLGVSWYAPALMAIYIAGACITFSIGD